MQQRATGVAVSGSRLLERLACNLRLLPLSAQCPESVFERLAADPSCLEGTLV